MTKSVCLAALFVLVATALGGTHKIPPGEGIATVQIPDKWQTKEQGELVEGISPDGAVYFLIIPVEHRKVGESIGEALRYIRSRGGIVVDSKSLTQRTGKFKDGDAHFASWKGKNETGAVEIKFVSFAVAPDELLVAAWWGAPDALKKYQSELDKILQSVRKAAGEKAEDRQ